MASSIDRSFITDTELLNSEFDDAESTADGGYGTSASSIVHHPIYGRAKETLILLQAYQRLLKTKQIQTVVVHGISGSGKTALVDALRNHILRDETTNPGYFVAGKYFQHAGGVQEPHSAIMAAFSDLCDLLAQSNDLTDARRRQIRKSLGADAPLLVKSISNLSSIVGNEVDEDMTPAGKEGSEVKFKNACKKFLHAVASERHPVVIFLDDIQWADEGSRQLIEIFLRDTSLKNVMLILAHRDEEASKAESILSHASEAPINIQLSHLDTKAIDEMVSSIVGSSSAGVHDLSALVAKRTAGNPFHISLFMEMINRKSLLVFEETTGVYSFNVDDIRMEMMASESLADLLMEKIADLLPGDITKTLKAASLLGYYFDEATLVAVVCADMEAKSLDLEGSSDISFLTLSREAVFVALEAAIKDGFIEKIKNGYQFIHDKLQVAFQSMIGGLEENQLHFLIGNAFLAGSTDDAAKMYNAAVHLNSARGFLQSPDQRVALAKINLDAARYCEEKSAFYEAAKMLQIALEAIGRDERWSAVNFDLTIEIMLSLARTQMISGQFEGCRETLRESLEHCKTVETKTAFLLIDVEAQNAEHEVDDSLSTAYAALVMLGVTMPQKAKIWHVVRKLCKVRYSLRSMTNKELVRLPVVADCAIMRTVKLLMHVCCHSFVKGDGNTGIYASLLALELTLKTGLSPYSPASFVFYGVAEMSLGKINRGYRYGKVSLAMLKRIPCLEADCYTVSFAVTMLMSRKDPLERLLAPLRRVAEIGYDLGDLLHASYSSAQSFHILNYMGTNLATVEASMRARYDMVSDLRQDVLLLWFQPALQYVINMQCDVTNWEHLSDFSGEIMNEEVYFRQVHADEHVFLTAVGYLVKAEIASYFDQFFVAASMYEKIEALEEQTVQMTFFAPFYNWNVARVHFNIAALSKKRWHTRKGRKYRKLLERMQSSGCPNSGALLAFLDAEKNAQDKHITNETALHEIYNRGIDYLAKSKLLPFEGILNEKAGFEFARRGWYVGADQYFQRALQIYGYEWGATAKYNRLVEKREQVLPRMNVKTSAISNPRGTCIIVTPSIDS